MNTYQIKDHEVPLFPMKYVKSIFHTTRSGILRKEKNGLLPPASYRDGADRRIYSIEDLAIMEYVYKEVFPYKQGTTVPQWVKELIADALLQSRKVVLEYGKSRGPEDWAELHAKYNQFDKYRVQLYVESWRRRLLDVNKFFPELVEEEDY